MAIIIESAFHTRRTIRLSSDDVISVVREYQRITHKCSGAEEIRNRLQDSVIYVPEDV